MADRRNSGYDRRDRDFYPTPAWVTEALLLNVEFPHEIWEPACGEGDMARVLDRFGFKVRCSDIAPAACSGGEVIDFIKDGHGPAHAVVTNPPYGKLADAFAMKALDVTKNLRGKVALLLPTDYDHASGRLPLFKDHPAFSCKLVLTSRIRWFEGRPEDKGKQPMGNHAWFIWDWKNTDAPTIKYHARIK